MLLDHYLPYLFENSEQLNVYTHNTAFQWAVQLTEYPDYYVFCTVHCDVIMQDEPMKRTIFQINTGIQF